MWIIRSDFDDVYANLAIEECLLSEAAGAGGILFWYRNRDAVVLGKNQNPWRECRVENLVSRGVPVARRVSGGGTVYHDPGNLNYSLMFPRAVYERDRCYAWLIGGLRACGVPAARLGSTAVGAEGRKCSGTAFAYRASTVLHHGTLLLRTDLGRLKAAMRTPDARFEGHAVASEPAEVINLDAVRPGLSVEAWISALERALPSFFPEAVSLRRLGADAVPAARWRSLARRNRGIRWRLGAGPPFGVQGQSADGCTVSLSVRDDRVRSARFQPMDAGDIRLRLRGLAFRPLRLAERLRQDPECPHRPERDQAADWLSAAWA